MTPPRRPVRFTKMSGAGNDFVVLTAEDASGIPDLEAWVRAVCTRGLSVGADGVLVVGPLPDGSVEVRFRNPDGGEAFCGNGTRCATRFAALRGWTGAEALLRTRAGDVRAEIVEGHVRLHLPPPRDLGRFEVTAHGRLVEGRRIDAGSPHAVVRVPDLRGAPVADLGPAIRRHPSFGERGVNVDFVAWTRDGALGIRTYERGVEAETLSCGSGAVAAAFAARLDGEGDDLRVLPWSGVPLHVRFVGPTAEPFEAVLEGDARVVFQGALPPEGVTGFPPR